MENLTIRLEPEKDYRAVEELTREAFWNVYKPGADEHYFIHMIHICFASIIALITLQIQSITPKNANQYVI